MYWEHRVDCSFPTVAALMSRNRFEDLLQFFHAADNNNLDPNDKFAKVRPLWKLLNARWVKYYPGDKNLSIDESMIPFYGKHGTKQHIHGKPIRFGYNNWSICTRLGYLIYGELYQGASTGNTHPELGVGASVVLDLISKLPQGSYSFYFDNFFTSLPLLDELQKVGHDGTGTIRAHRTEKAPLKDPKEMKKTSRGSHHQCTDVLSNITLVRYNDNNIVTVASTQCGSEPKSKVKRYCDKKKKEVDQPRCFVKYNKFGFRKNISTVDAVLKLTNNIVKNINSNKTTLAVFLDLAKAFDTVPIPILLTKLYLIGVRGTQHNLFESYLTGRSQMVKIGHHTSDELQISYGVPQGSILGPTLFLVFINDMCSIPLKNGTIITYADDTVLLFNDVSWANLQKITHTLPYLNTSKTKFIPFSPTSAKSTINQNHLSLSKLTPVTILYCANAPP